MIFKRKKSWYQIEWENEHGHIDGVYKLNEDKATHNRLVHERCVAKIQELYDELANEKQNLQRLVIQGQIDLLLEMTKPIHISGTGCSGVYV